MSDTTGVTTATTTATTTGATTATTTGAGTTTTTGVADTTTIGATPSPMTVHEEVHAELHHSSTRTVCIAIDGSKNSSYAVQWAIDNILRKETDQVVLLHVRSLVTMPALSYGAPFADFGVLEADAMSKREDAAKRDSHELLINTAKIFKQHGLHVRAIALRGDAREELVYKIEDVRADMVVMGSRGLSAISRLFLGSVSEHLIHNIKCPVIVTRDSTI
ncbi:hypothetical protein BASA50_000453 [Batrachochytrium salamandrivorans]|uniref:UspA domain-containing protein n=1 Tax=Batrachochytrium salamandrivorans TaxID=1357716 RepID=A0ABQ8EUF5_9FUNG|nr:hypothetical protein BASA50_000453 [Batrachochytrium salamandrivorans]